jgi:ABC-2 type transport system permease protein
VLRRLGATPLGRPRLIAAKIAGVAVVELVQIAVLVPVAYLLGWQPASPSWFAAVAAVLLGTLAFAGIGLSLAGRLRGEVNLAAANGLYLVLLLLGGMVIPFSELPGPMRAVARVLPSGALADVLREALAAAGSHPGASWVVLAAWAVAMPLLAAATFRWE